MKRAAEAPLAQPANEISRQNGATELTGDN
jgi:hypothetical protein